MKSVPNESTQSAVRGNIQATLVNQQSSSGHATIQVLASGTAPAQIHTYLQKSLPAPAGIAVNASNTGTVTTSTSSLLKISTATPYSSGAAVQIAGQAAFKIGFGNAFQSGSSILI